jgi:hypothetical protein
MAVVEDTSERSRIHRVSAASRRSPHSLSSVARHPTVGHAPLAAAAPLPARVRPEDRPAAAPQDRPTLNTSHDDVDARVCDRIEPTIPPASQDARVQVVVGQRTDGIPSAGWLAGVDHPAAARVPDQGADRVGIIPTSVIRAGGNSHHGRPSNLEDELSLRNLKARKLQNVQQHYRRQDFLYYGLTVDSHSSIRTALDAEDGFVLLCQNLDLCLCDARDAVVYALSGAALECLQGKVKDWRRLDRHWTVHDVFHILGSMMHYRRPTAKS